MVKNATKHPPSSLLEAAVGILDTEGLLELVGEVGDVLLRRAHEAEDPRAKRVLHLSVVHIVELRGRLRMLRAYELEQPSAAPVPDAQHGAAQPGEPPRSDPSGSASTTTGAAESLDTRPCFNCRGTMSSHTRACSAPLADDPPRCERCKEDIGHDGPCRQLPDEAPSSSSPSELQRRGPRGPEAAEGTGEAGRAKQGPVDLAAHLAVLKGGAA